MHAIVDAMLGAAGAGDIGLLFPDTDDRFRGAASEIFLRGAMEQLRGKGLEPVNIDVTIICKEPKISEYRDVMRKNISRITGLDIGAISIKGKSGNGVGAEGGGGAVSAFAAVSAI